MPKKPPPAFQRSQGAHERFHQGNGPDRLDLGNYVRDVCHDMTAPVSGCCIEVTFEASIKMMTDRVVPIALVVNELIPTQQIRSDENQNGISGFAWHVAPMTRLNFRCAMKAGVPTDFELRSAPALGIRILARW
jgi:hypothetical protein